MAITTSWLEGSKDIQTSDGAPRGAAQLAARRRAGGVFFYCRYTYKGKDAAVPLGLYDKTGVKGLTLLQARERAGELAKLHRAGTKDLRGHLAREAAAKEAAQLKADLEAKRAAADATRGTLRQLVNAYVESLKQAGKKDWSDAECTFRNHLLEPYPELADRKAADITAPEFARVIAAVQPRVKKGKKGTSGARAADKLRSGLKTAYNNAISAPLSTDAAMGELADAFNIAANPLTGIRKVKGSSNKRNRVLVESELGAYLRHLDALRPGPKRDALWLELWLGGQRPVQMLRAGRDDVDLNRATIKLLDFKGRREEPRVHILPLVPEALALLRRRIAALQPGEPLFSNDRLTSMRIETLTGAVKEISAAMVAAGESIEPFQHRDLRRSCETGLQSLDVSRDVRGQILSHGQSGVQSQVYEQYTYKLEKEVTLLKWAKELARLKASKPATVTDIATKKGGRRG